MRVGRRQRFGEYIIDVNFNNQTDVRIDYLVLAYDYISENAISIHTQVFSLAQVQKFCVEFSSDNQNWETLKETQWNKPGSDEVYFTFAKEVNKDGVYYFRIKNRETGETYGVTTFQVIFENIKQKHEDEAVDSGGDDEKKGILEAIMDIPNKIITGLLDALKSLFIPADDFFNNWIADINTYFGDRFGIVYYPFELLIDFLTRIGNIQDTGNYVIHVPELKLLDTTIIHSFDYDLNSLLQNETFKHIHTIAMIVVDAILRINVSSTC